MWSLGYTTSYWPPTRPYATDHHLLHLAIQPVFNPPQLCSTQTLGFFYFMIKLNLWVINKAEKTQPCTGLIVKCNVPNFPEIFNTYLWAVNAWEKPLKLQHHCWVIKPRWRSYHVNHYGLNSDLKAPELYQFTLLNIFLNSHFFSHSGINFSYTDLFLTRSVWDESYCLCFTHSWLTQYVFKIDVSVHYFRNKICCYFSKKLQKLKPNSPPAPADAS